MNIQADLEKLALDINKLKVQHDLFFIGATPKLPLELKKTIENTIKKYRNAQNLNYAQRFHFNTLLSKYNSLNELWTKMLREFELTGKSPIFNRKPAVAVNGDNGGKSITSEIISGNREDLEKFRKLHSEYVAARKASGNGHKKIPFKKFIRQIIQQANSIREKSGCQDIEIRILIEDEKVLVKAKGIQ